MLKGVMRTTNLMRIQEFLNQAQEILYPITLRVIVIIYRNKWSMRSYIHLKEGADDDDDIVPHPETDRKIAKQESGPTVAEENNMYGDALVTNKQSEDRRVPTSIFPVLRNWQYESSESSCRYITL
jgi:hypothetical protein